MANSRFLSVSLDGSRRSLC